MRYIKEQIQELQIKLNQPIIVSDNDDYNLEEYKRLKNIEEEQQEKEKLSIVNRKNREIKEILKESLSIEFPSSDVENQDGTFNKRKIKNFPEFMEFKKKHFIYNLSYSNGVCSGFWNNKFTLHILNDKGERIIDLKELCELNRVLYQDMPFSEFKYIKIEIKQECERVEKILKESSEKVKGLGVYFLEENNLINRQRVNYYTYY